MPLALVLPLLGVALSCWLPCYWHRRGSCLLRAHWLHCCGEALFYGSWCLNCSLLLGSHQGGMAQARIPAPGLSPLLLRFWAAAVALPLALVLSLHIAATCCWLPPYRHVRVSCSFFATSKHLWRFIISFSAVIIASLHQLFAENLGSCSASHCSIG